MLGENVKTTESLRLIERRSFMKLPLEERRRLLSEQAARMAEQYVRETESRQEWQEGDFVEY